MEELRFGYALCHHLFLWNQEAEVVKRQSSVANQTYKSATQQTPNRNPDPWSIKNFHVII